MASGTINLSSNNSKLASKIDWSSSSNGSSANTSNVSATLYARRTDGYTTKGTWSGSLEIADSKQTFSKPSTSIGSSWVALVSISNKVIAHNNDGTSSVWIAGVVNAPSGTSLAGASASGNQTVTLDRIPRYGTSNQSFKSKTETTIAMNWSSNSTVDYIWYSVNNGSSWTGIDVADGTSGSYTISGLKANTTYNIKTRIRRKDSQLTTDSTALSVTTYNYPYITTVGTTNLTIGNSQKLTLYNPLSRNVTIRMYKDNINGTQLYSGSTTGTSITFTPNASTLYASIPNSQSGNCVYAAIYSSITNVTSTQKYTINTSNCIPTFTAFTYKDNNSTTANITGNNQLQIQNKSSLVVTATAATAKNSAKIVKYVATINGRTYESTTTTINIGAISSAGTLSLVVKAVDSRGLTAQVPKNITVVGYTQPSYTVNVTRKNNYEEETTYKITNGTYNLLTISGSNKNAIQVSQYRYKESGGNYGSWKPITLTKSGSSFSYSEIVGNLDNTKTFIFQTQIIDKLTTVTNEFTLKNGTPVLAIRRTAIGINKIPTISRGLDIDGNINFTNYTDKIIMSGATTDNRKLSIDTGNYNFNVSSVGGWANGMKFRTNDGNTALGCIGAYGGGNTLEYYWIGKAYNDYLFRLNNDGAMGVKGGITSNNGALKSKKTSFTGEIFNGATGSAQWVKIGTWSNMRDNDNCFIKVFSGNGYNGGYNQNTLAIIQIKNGWQQTQGTSSAFGLTCYVLNPDNITNGFGIRGMATAHNKIDVWLYCPWAYWNGNYVFEGLGSWTNANVHQSTEPTTGVRQSAITVALQNYPITLYNNSSGTNGTVTLSNSAGNYNYLEIFYGVSGGSLQSVKVFAPNGKTACLTLAYLESNYVRLQAPRAYINGTSITKNNVGGSNQYAAGGVDVFTNNAINIFKVIGWR